MRNIALHVVINNTNRMKVSKNDLTCGSNGISILNFFSLFFFFFYNKKMYVGKKTGMNHRSLLTKPCHSKVFPLWLWYYELWLS